jgi:hypothetical protein
LLLLLDNQNITTQKHSRTQRLHSSNILYNYSMMTSCCKVSERKATKSIYVYGRWDGRCENLQLTTYLLKIFTLLYIKALPNIS